MSREGEYLERQHAIELVYTSGEERRGCIIRGSTLPGAIRYSRGAVDYSLCGTCGHLNGMHLISDEFNEYAYGDVSDRAVPADSRPYTKEFSSEKMEEEFNEVVDRIYAPKAAFLTEVLTQRTFGNPTDLRVVDFGCGSGHFVEALMKAEFQRVQGVDSLPEAVSQASTHGLGDHVSLVHVANAETYLQNCGADVISMMCVLPHLQEPIRALQTMRAGGVRWTFQKLPMWSFGTLLEAAFPDLRSRVLGMDHTHVFTWDSL